jgi:type IV pilus assembly protein PilW
MRTTMTVSSRIRGFSLVELMVAVTLAIVTGLAVIMVLSNYESRKRTVTVGNDAELNAAVGSYMVEREVRMAGAGLTAATGMLCPAGVNAFYNGTTVLDGATLAPVAITDGGADAGGSPLPDRLRVVRSDAAFGVAPSTIVQLMASPEASLTVIDDTGLAAGDLFMASAADGSKICTLMQMSQAPQASGSGWTIAHAHANAAPYNPANANVFTNAVPYDVGDIVTNLGQFGLRTFRVICNDGAAPSLTNTCNLVSYNQLTSAANPALADVDSISSQVVNFQVQYGVAPAGGQTVNAWTDATGGWAAPSAADVLRIKAVRMAIVTRGNLERDIVTPTPLVIWDATLSGTALSMPLTNDQRRYRYKVVTVIVPLINVIWAAV